MVELVNLQQILKISKSFFIYFIIVHLLACVGAWLLPLNIFYKAFIVFTLLIHFIFCIRRHVYRLAKNSIIALCPDSQEKSVWAVTFKDGTTKKLSLSPGSFVSQYLLALCFTDADAKKFRVIILRDMLDISGFKSLTRSCVVGGAK
ncbi:MAG: hypothetical protein COB50_05030 [Thiotrichales bacterium]|nr:MAG: hypothetical protein COB50_05030 [Thiotrichales bacterium]